MERRRQADLLTDKLLGRKRFDWNLPIGNQTDDFMLDALKYRISYNMMNPSPRTSFIISGMEGI
jgi:hypothetical protein